MEYTQYPKSDKLEAGTWKRVRMREGNMIWFKCPKGHIGNLGDHFIHKDGKVSPSVVCPEDGCGFHEWIWLEGWEQK